MEKKFTINYDRSFVKTSYVSAILLLIIGLIGATVMLLLKVPIMAVLAACLSSFIFFLFFMCLSKILENLYLSRTLLEIKMASEGYEITVQKNNH